MITLCNQKMDASTTVEYYNKYTILDISSYNVSADEPTQPAQSSPPTTEF